MTDPEVVCQACGRPFVFTAERQRLFDLMGFHAAPLYCRQCRKAQEAQGEAQRRRARKGTDDV